ncbi:phosphoglucosamine mutase [Sporichthya sp.]|uniref:phosphoglucosamine mutase n=1 Tax=Sporichthya sp. TaxID=65475 RepID=UPI00179E86B2|nr:phosphoglucosamine mutase [Sporichthya sp.]MBA3745487.1 phosphoglucosamine mutase [Sporichthya sp.]
MARLFGTDGVRGVANVDLTAELAMDLSAAAARVLSAHRSGGGRPLAVVGRDPRASGEFLEAAVVAGLASAGTDVVRLGVLPTPGVAWLTAMLNADLGVMLSASHNPAPDNGIKFFARGGHKLPDATEDEIAALLDADWQRPTGGDVGRVRDETDAARRYLDFLLTTVPNRLDGITVVIDCANGAASEIAPVALRAAGAEVHILHSEPDGLNINLACGSTHPEDLMAAVKAHGAHAGLAFDGDADRCLAVDAEGNLVDGDQILAVLALAMKESGHLADDTVVVTVMSNLGFRLAMTEAGVKVIDTAVGDRYVLEAMRAGGYTLGGEQSGHVVMLEHATTGDGLLTALHLLARMAATGQSLAELAALMTRLPQVLINVKGVNRSGVGDNPDLAEAVAAAEAELGSSGRVLLRPSGTEPLVRVMVEAASADQAQAVADRLADAVRTHLPLP